ncbi:hypothetical protein OFO01_07030 [Campylobacter sp. JMF_01 NE2]|uniref:hypothetical protein n=1 Tax=unclassified Campylobacter TaxID=2593542 RepID=UPI0022EA0E65|nr:MULTISPECIES: hypothetical protein [unclassified Campylobacter]MDA3053284.1 hypothetical protein [Campylobacter sp. JMF_03 NE3]MDA3067533.1 hypothetical protein [Campylobacter sp. JMF_01 NE2]
MSKNQIAISTILATALLFGSAYADTIDTARNTMSGLGNKVSDISSKVGDKISGVTDQIGKYTDKLNSIPGINIGGSGISFSASDILGIGSGSILDNSAGPLKYSCSLKGLGEFGFGLGDIDLGSIAKGIDLGILQCDFSVDVNKAVCKDVLVNKTKEKAYGLFNKGKDEVRGIAQEGKERLKRKIFKYGGDDAIAYGKTAQKKLENYCKALDDKIWKSGSNGEKSIVQLEIDAVKEDVALNKLINKMYGISEEGLRNNAHANLNFRNDSSIKAILADMASDSNGVVKEPTTEQIQTALNVHKQIMNDFSTNTTTQKLAEYNTQMKATVMAGEIDDEKRVNVTRELEKIKKGFEQQAKDDCASQGNNATEYQKCYSGRIATLTEKCYNEKGQPCYELTNNIKEQREQKDAVIEELNIQTAKKKTTYTAEEINNMPLTDNERAQMQADLIAENAEKLKKEIKQARNIELSNQLSRLEVQHAEIMAEGFDVNANVIATQAIIDNSQKAAQETINGIIGGSKSSPSGIGLPSF